MIRGKLRSGKYHATVHDVSDPQSLGRIRVQVLGFEPGKDITPWCHACAPMAGSEYGMFFLPQVGDHVWVELAANGQEWIFSGFHWSHQKPKPMDGAPDVRVLRMPGGQQLKFDDDGDVEVSHNSGARMTLKPNGDIELNGNTYKIVNTGSLCPFTGAPHFQGSLSEKCKG